MSAYIVDRSVILSLVRGAISLEIISPEFAASTAKMLWGENIESVLYRYPDDTLETAPGTVGESYEINEAEILGTENPDPKRLSELIGEYSYQSCEHKGWEDSRAHLIICQLKHAAADALVAWEAEQVKARTFAREEARKQFELDAAKGRELLAGRKATFCIVAKLQQDECDSQSDYFSSRTVKTVVLALSSHGRDLFSEMRKGAALFPETAHLGPGKGVFTPLVVLTCDVRSNGSSYWKGCGSHWHSDLYQGHDAPSFETRAEAEAFIAAAGEPHSIDFDGALVTFAWEIREESVENRQKWSMGSGYFLQAGSKYSGWRVSKSSIDDCALAAIGRGDHTWAGLKVPAPKAPAAVVSEPTPAHQSRSEFATACYIG